MTSESHGDRGAPAADHAAIALLVEVAGRRWRTTGIAHDISIPLEFDGAQPTFFGAAAATQQPLTAGTFVGDVRRGGSCNCVVHTLIPHCNGTHTESVGHITAERVSVREMAARHLSAALLVSVQPVPAESTEEISDPRPHTGDRLITRTALQASLGDATLSAYRALVVRTLPNARSKLTSNYDEGPPAPYFSSAAMRWIVEQGIDTLVVDLPSLDRAQDEGRLTAHRLFWGMPAGATSIALATRASATVTELAFIPEGIPDGPYLLNLQVAPFGADAAPSRPILLPLVPA